MKCENESYPEFNGKECQCADCTHLDFFCVVLPSSPCDVCDGPVTNCDKTPEEDIIAS